MREEKAQSMLNKWYLMRRSLYVRDPDEPPPLVEDCNSIRECYRWRETIMKEIGDKVAEIQNAALGNYRIRALNDEINKLMNHKRMWEARIRELGGPDFRQTETKFYDSEGLELPGSGGYKYFGAAKDLPGVRELFFKEAPAAPQKNLQQVYKALDGDYFGLFALDAQTVEECEKLERAWRKQSVERWIEEHYELLAERHPNLKELSYQEVLDILGREDFVRPAEVVEVKAEELASEQQQLALKKQELLRIYAGEVNDDVGVFLDAGKLDLAAAQKIG